MGDSVHRLVLPLRVIDVDSPFFFGVGRDMTDEERENAERCGRYDNPPMSVLGVTREGLAAVEGKELAELFVAAPELQKTLAEIADLFGIGRDARTHATIITNVKNALRRSDILSMIEEHHSTTEMDEDGVEIEECPLRWGEDPDAYLARYVALLGQNGRVKQRRRRLARNYPENALPPLSASTVC